MINTFLNKVKLIFSEKKSGINSPKVIRYLIISSGLTLLNIFLVVFLSTYIFNNIILSNFISDIFILSILFFVSQKYIFYHSGKRIYLKAALFLFLRIMIIILFSFLLPFFIYFTEYVLYEFDFNFNSTYSLIIAKILMINFSIIINFYITFISIEYIEKLMHKLKIL
jgi:hypothetical protein